MKEQVREIATEVWQTSHWTNEQIKRLESFYSMVRNAALEDAAQICDAEQAKNEEKGQWLWEAKKSAAAIRQLKDNT